MLFRTRTNCFDNSVSLSRGGSLNIEQSVSVTASSDDPWSRSQPSGPRGGGGGGVTGAEEHAAPGGRAVSAGQALPIAELAGAQSSKLPVVLAILVAGESPSS